MRIRKYILLQFELFELYYNGLDINTFDMNGVLLDLALRPVEPYDHRVNTRARLYVNPDADIPLALINGTMAFSRDVKRIV